MKFINFDNTVNKNNENYINKSVFTPQHVSNTIIIVKQAVQRQTYYLTY